MLITHYETKGIETKIGRRGRENRNKYCINSLVNQVYYI